MVEENDRNSISYPLEDNQFDIFVTGFISNENDFCHVKIMKPITGVANLLEFEPIDSAQVDLLFKDNEIAFSYNDSLQSYISDSKVEGIPGVEYTLAIFEDGRSYIAKEKFPVFEENEISIPFLRSELYDDNGDLSSPRDEFVDFSIYEHNFGYDHFNIWQWVESSSNNTIPKVSLHQLIQRSSFKAYSHKSALPQGVFPGGFKTSGVSGFPKDSIEIIQSFVSDEYKSYLVSVFNETDWRTSIFSSIHGNTKSNFSEGATGYFYAVNTKRYRTTISELIQ